MHSQILKHTHLSHTELVFIYNFSYNYFFHNYVIERIISVCGHEHKPCKECIMGTHWIVNLWSLNKSYLKFSHRFSDAVAVAPFSIFLTFFSSPIQMPAFLYLRRNVFDCFCFGECTRFADQTRCIRYFFWILSENVAFWHFVAIRLCGYRCGKWCLGKYLHFFLPF